MSSLRASEEFYSAGILATRIKDNQTYLYHCIRDLSDLIEAYYRDEHNSEAIFQSCGPNSTLQLSIGLKSRYSDSNKQVYTSIEVELFVMFNVLFMDFYNDFTIQGEHKMDLANFFEYCESSGKHYVEKITPEQILSYNALCEIYKLSQELFPE